MWISLSCHKFEISLKKKLRSCITIHCLWIIFLHFPVQKLSNKYYIMSETILIIIDNVIQRRGYSPFKSLHQYSMMKLKCFNKKKGACWVIQCFDMDVETFICGKQDEGSYVCDSSYFRSKYYPTVPKEPEI